MSQKFVLHTGDDRRETIMENLRRFLSLLPDEKSWVVEIKQYRKSRSTEQNSALWGVAYPALEEATGQGVNDWHEYMLGEHFGWVECSLFGKKKLKPARTTTTGYDGQPDTLPAAEFADYYDFIQRRAAVGGVFVPDPDPFWRDSRGKT